MKYHLVCSEWVLVMSSEDDSQRVVGIGDLDQGMVGLTVFVEQMVES